MPRPPGRAGRHPRPGRPKRRAKTDRADARHRRELLLRKALPESWIPPAHVADVRAQVRLRKALMDQRTAWHQRIHAVLYHHGLPERSWLLTTQGAPGWPASSCHSSPAKPWTWPCARSTSWTPSWTGWTPPWPTSPAASRAARPSWAATGSAGPAAVSIWAEFGDGRRFANSRQAVRFTGLDITVAASDGKRARGHLARQGPPVLRWALHQAAMCAARPTSPDHAYYLQVRTRLGGKRAALSVARKLAREAYHTLHKLGDQALEPVVLQPAAWAADTRRAMLHRSPDVVRPAPGCSCRHALVVDGPHRTSGRAPPRGTRAPIMSPEHAPSTEIRLDARPP